MRDEIRTEIVNHIDTHCPQHDEHLRIDEDTRFDELVIDSLEMLELVFALEARFAVETDEKELAELETIGDLVNLLENARAMAA